MDIRRHPDWNSITEEYDFALYRLTKNVTTYGPKAVLNTKSSVPSTGQLLTVMGKGRRWNSASSVSNVLRHVVVSAVSNDDCDWEFNPFIGEDEFFPKVMFCAGGQEGKGACRGDSGGPIVIRNGGEHTVVGVVSFGRIPCGGADNPSIYARVSAVTGWIKTVACNEWGRSVNGLCPLPVPVSTCSPGSRELKVTVQTDSWPAQNSILLKDGKGKIIWNSNYYEANKLYTDTTCLNPNLCNSLTFLDTAGNGLSGNENLRIQFGSNVVYNGKTLGVGNGFTQELGNCDLDFLS